MDLCKQNFIKAVDEINLGLQQDFGPSHMIEQSVDAAYLTNVTISMTLGVYTTIIAGSWWVMGTDSRNIL